MAFLAGSKVKIQHLSISAFYEKSFFNVFDEICKSLFKGFSSILQCLHILILEGFFFMTNDWIELSILAIDFHEHSSQDSLKAMAEM